MGISFGGTVIKLGTQRHRALLKEVDDLHSVGRFALTELGFGNNATKMETTAHYGCQPVSFDSSVCPPVIKCTNGCINKNIVKVTEDFFCVFALGSRDSRVGHSYTNDQWAKVLD